jgi:hypothetical protein
MRITSLSIGEMIETHSVLPVNNTYLENCKLLLMHVVIGMHVL